MKVPVPLRILALTVATTGFYTLVGQLVPQKEVQPPKETVLKKDMTPDELLKAGRDVMEGKGLCFTCHTVGKSGALRFPDLAGIGGAGRLARARALGRRLPRAVDLRARRLHRARLQPGHADDQQAADRPLRPGDPGRDRLPPEHGREGHGHARLEGLAARGGSGRERRAPPRPRRARGAMETLHALGFLRLGVVLAVVAGFVGLRFLRASTLAWAIGCWLVLYVLLGFGFATPIPSSVVKLYMGIVTLSLAAYVTSSDGRRADFARPIVALATEPRYRALLAAVLVLLPALAAAQALARNEGDARGPGVRTHGPPGPPDTVTVRDKTIDIAHGTTTRCASSRRATPRRSAPTWRAAGARTTATASSATATPSPGTGCSFTA